jgi:lipoprotein signal peptidase
VSNNYKRKSFFDFIVQHKFLWLIVVGVLGIIADQGTKIWAQQTLAEPYEITEQIIKDGEMKPVTKKVYYPIKVIEVIPNAFNLIYKENPAAAFSLTRSLPSWFRRPMLIGISILATIFFLFWYFRMKANDGLLLFSFSLILAGAVGNLLDRIRLGYVIDFLDVYAGIFGYHYLHWPTFNVADSLIVIGAIGVIFRTIWPLKPDAKTRIS